MLQLLNVFFFVLHTVLVLFNSLGWIWRSTRRWNLATLGVTAFSWFVMGAWKGVGYCMCTDWHMQVRRAMGIHDTAHTYIQLMVQSMTGLTPPTQLTMTFTGLVFAVSVIASVGFNIQDAKRAKSQSLDPQEA